MVHCHDMNSGDIYYCQTCVLELKVMKECDSCCEEDTCDITHCNFMCCGEELLLKT